jgi:hypothetical protein
VTELVHVEGEVVRVVRGGFEDTHEGGTSSRDQSVVRLTQPSELAGRLIRVVVDDPEADALRNEGAVAFDVDPTDLELDAIFSGALMNVRRGEALQ